MSYGHIAILRIPQLEKNHHSYCLDLTARHPTEAATLPAKSLDATEVTDYHEQLVLNLSYARALAAKSISKAQQNQRAQYDQHTKSSKLESFNHSVTLRMVSSGVEFLSP